VSIPIIIYLGAVLAACLTAAGSVPLWQKWCLRTGLVDDPGHRKIHEHPVPLAGGLALMTGLLMPLVLGAVGLTISLPGGESSQSSSRAWLFPPETLDLLRHGLGRRKSELAGIIGGAVGMVFVGWLDDKHELSARAKFGGQLAVAALVAASGVRITLFVPNLVFSYAITILWLLTVINSFNFIDNMNGLCAGVGAIGAWYFATLAALADQYLVALIAFLAFGALLGFLPYNFPKARAFLGDAGSHLVGYLLAVLAVLPHFYSSRQGRRWAVLIPLVVLAVPLVDLVWVVLVRWRLGRPFYEGDNNHLSHQLVRSGLTRTRAVLVLWLTAALVGALTYLGR
jgi:UDP-GlcNAc:undecaprenyl-phosphate/decaprenyl-phosphate GlcNAc-1-phosphate transferase